jgi:replicative DNA helicase
LAEIVSRAEEEILKVSANVDQSGSPESIAKDIAERVEQLLASEPVDQVGIPTGFPLFDEAIGGGHRPGTVTVIGARPKVGKSFLAMNIARNVAGRGIPVLYLDTELTHDYQQSRMMSMDSGCPIYAFETGKFKNDAKLVQSVRNSATEMDKLPFDYQSISGMSHTEAMMVARRWIIKTVGLNDRGEANPCLVVYDYMKLTSSNGLSNHTPEYILLGLMLTEMHNFTVKFKIPMVGFVQLNRVGIESEDTSVIAGSDRIMWLASSFTILKNKDENDISLGCGWEYGNKKLLVVETRHGSGLEQDGDYINLHCSLRPMVGKDTANGLIREGFRFSDVVRNTAVQISTNANVPGKAA